MLGWANLKSWIWAWVVGELISPALPKPLGPVCPLCLDQGPCLLPGAADEEQVHLSCPCLQGQPSHIAQVRDRASSPEFPTVSKGRSQLSSDICLGFGGNMSHGYQHRLLCGRAMNPDMVLGGSTGLGYSYHHPHISSSASLHWTQTTVSLIASPHTCSV